jgi:hypothetical protein
MFKDSTG